MLLISLGLLILDPSEKTVSSRQGMHQTQATSPLMEAWCTWNEAQIPLILKSLTQGNWPETGERIEHNARVLHALIQSGWPPLSYTPAVTAEALARVVRLRQEGVPVYATQDAGAQLILFFPDEAAERVRAVFPTLQIVSDILTSPAR